MKKEVLNEFKKQFKSKDFGSRKITWHKNFLLILTDDLLQGIELQYDSRKDEFTFNLFIRPLFIGDDVFYIQPGSRICSFIDRINDVEPTRERWYNVADAISIRSLVADIYKMFERIVFPYFDSNDSCSKLLENYALNKFDALRWSMKLSELYDMAYIAAKCSETNLFNTYCNEYIIGEQKEIDTAPSYWPEEMFNHKRNRMNSILELQKIIRKNDIEHLKSFFQKNIEKSMIIYKIPKSLIK